MASVPKTRRRADVDGAWKEALRRHLRQFLDILFPSLAAAVDWSAPVVFLDKELRVATRKAKGRKRHADVFVRVGLRSGASQLLFLHAEVQNEPDEAFARRMFGYNCRLGDLAGEEVLRSLLKYSGMSRATDLEPRARREEALLGALLGVRPFAPLPFGLRRFPGETVETAGEAGRTPEPPRGGREAPTARESMLRDKDHRWQRGGSSAFVWIHPGRLASLRS